MMPWARCTECRSPANKSGRCPRHERGFMPRQAGNAAFANGRKNSSGRVGEAPVGESAAPVDSLPTDAAQRRCVAGPVTVSSDTARAGVSS